MKALTRIMIMAMIAPAVLTSCYSTIGVKVDTFDIDKMKSSPEYLRTNQEKELQQYTRMIESNYFDDIKSSLLKITKDALSKQPIATGSSQKISAAEVEKIMVVVTPKITEKIDDLKQKTVTVFNALKGDLNKTTDSKRIYDEAYKEYINSRNALLGFAEELKEEIESKDVFDLQMATQKAITEINNVYGTSIVDDEMASFVAKAPEDFWKRYKSEFYTTGNTKKSCTQKSRINRTKVTTLVGNSDIAIKMNGPGNFVIKGARVDGDEAARASFKVLAQGIKYIAAAYGVPVVSASGSSDDPAVQIPEIAELEKNKASAEIVKKQFQAQTDAFLRVLATQKANLLSQDAAKRKEAIQAIKVAYEYYKTQLVTQ